MSNEEFETPSALCYLPTIQEMERSKVSTFFVTSDLFISAAFRTEVVIKVCKIISMIRMIDWRALIVCARKLHPRPANLKKYAKIIISWGIFFGW